MIDRRLAAMSALVALSACSGSGGGGSSTPTASTSTLSVAMVDAPFAMSGATVTAVNLGIDKVEAVGASGPVVLKDFGSTPDVVNILGYTSQSSPLQFPAATIPAGSYQQIRLLLDTATTTISYTDASGVAHTNVPLSVPSGTMGGFGNSTSTDGGDGQGTSGVKVNVGLDAQGGQTYGYILDFNAAQSIVETGNGRFMLKPVIVATAVQTAGVFSGTVTNNAGMPVVGAEVDALSGTTTVNSGVTMADGTFAINALPVGSYALVVKNTGTTSAGAAFTATNYDSTVGATLSVPGPFNVTNAATTNVGTIQD